ncbi:MAG: helix-turn-helix domain-containing protein [Armatimonadetes bacterium]|nr:helix-turn-helix domain-containing protein [Armatimonadota bacterium]
MTLDYEACHRALAAHDSRFDGLFFVAVKTTGIYCRPVCTVKPPKRENCTFYENAAMAESAGYRPCLKCRPELAPGRSIIDSSNTLANYALRRLERGEESVATIAQKLNITPRHLHRVVHAAIGVSPVEFLQTSRLLHAKRLLADTAMPIGEVAMASGFGSLRRFNDAFRQHYRLTPGKMRRKRVSEADILTFTLGYRPPYDWESLIGFLAPRAIKGVEHVADGVYRRTWRHRKHSGWFAVRNLPEKKSVEVSVSASLACCVPALISVIRNLCDLNAEPDVIAQTLGPLASCSPGLRVPGCADGFEMAIRAILGQQVSVTGASTLAGRFAAKFGEPIETPFPELTTLTPQAQDIAATSTEEIATIGIPASRARTIKALAEAVADGLELRPGAPPECLASSLTALPGIGDWTAQYLLMRAAAWPDAFPSGDLGIQKALGLNTPQEIEAASQAWRPWRSYAAMHLWQSLKEKE